MLTFILLGSTKICRTKEKLKILVFHPLINVPFMLNEGWSKNYPPAVQCSHPSPCQPPPWPRCTMGLFSHRNYGINSRPPHQPLQQLVIHPPPPFTPPAILPSPATPATTPCNHLSTADMCLLFTQATFNVKWHSIWIQRGIRLAKIADNWRELNLFLRYIHISQRSQRHVRTLHLKS